MPNPVLKISNNKLLIVSKKLYHLEILDVRPCHAWFFLFFIRIECNLSFDELIIMHNLIPLLLINQGSFQSKLIGDSKTCQNLLEVKYSEGFISNCPFCWNVPIRKQLKVCQIHRNGVLWLKKHNPYYHDTE